MTSDTQPRTRAESGARRRAARRSADAAPIRTKKRMDLQGLRALAVGLVILNHAFDWPAGGFVGVDIFFVISGFLMTSLLYREYERTGTIKFFAFYRRRIRRLIPASATVILATVIGAWALFSSGRFLSTVWDGIASLFFVSNWRYAAEATDYFAQGAQTSPLQHYWSLSLEEQYYLIWPLAVLVIALLVAKHRHPRITAALVSLVITAGLFLVSLQLTQADIATAYFITPARLWELSVGATVAFCMPLFDRLPAVWRPMIMLVSLGGMVAAAVITPTAEGFPAPWALVAVLSTALFIAFPWHPERRSWLNPLDNPVLTHLGDISYSLYLWHFPALILITEAFRGLPGDKTPVPAVVSIVVTLVVAELSFRYVEETVRRSRWLEPSTKRRRGARLSKLHSYALTAGVMVAVAAVVLTVVVDRQARGGGDGGTDQQAQATSTPGSTAPPGGGGGALASIQSELSAALAATSWPETSPSIESVVASYSRDPGTDACSNRVYPGVDQCTWGAADAPVSVAIVGDSTSVAYVPLLRALADASNGQLKVTTLGMYSCPWIDVATSMRLASYQAACPIRKEQAIDNIIAMKPSILIVTNSYLTSTHHPEGGSVSLDEYGKGLDTYLQRVTASVGKIALVAPPVADKDIRECYSPRASPKDCVSQVNDVWKRRAAAETKWAKAVPNGVWVDTRQLFCVNTGCPAFSAGMPTKFDQVHLTEEYSRHVATGMAELLAENGVDLGGDSGSDSPSDPEQTSGGLPPADDPSPDGGSGSETGK
ncbi:acyltransferase family protein [Leifsonia sp. TF02-11]|uniref:acyltransferase family protein n=1 Tax=Leifsonia sp. TF02-11 TaxID=2815212 RepID=UPI001AA1257E|nr:acyltransferase family protein [Leifsonia sp. TF02-11]MBO1738382.1 acyltransferase [Leifsonia sp. TF02-11]